MRIEIVQSIIEVRVVDMKLIGVDPDNQASTNEGKQTIPDASDFPHTVLLMHLLDLPPEEASSNHVVVELIPSR